MSFLRDEYIFGVVESRRLGNSLGINVLPLQKKVCNFNCIYCECGLNGDATNKISNQVFPDADIIKAELEIALTGIHHAKFPLDAITFSGNGEPTLNPDFEKIVSCTIEMRNTITPTAKVAVLSNATTLHNPSVLKALKKIDKPILKLDSAIDNTLGLMNLHKIQNNSTDESDGSISKKVTVSNIVSGMAQFEGDFILQIMFLRGVVNGTTIDNTTESEVKALLEVIKEVSPKTVMIYPIDRQTPINKLVKIPAPELQQIAKKIRKIGTNVQVAV